jgi:lipid-A-disaccharide synthase-like uncharacterized protein
MFVVWCLGLLAIDFLHQRHSVFSQEALPGFYGLFGFLGLLMFVLFARFVVRFVILKKEDYYD